MELEALRLVISEDDLNRMARQWTPEDAPVRNLNARIAPEGVTVTGDAAQFAVSFETRWTLRVAERMLLVRLEEIRAGWLPSGMLRGMLVSVLRDAAAKTPGVSVEEEAVRVDLDAVLKHHGLELKTNLSAVRCEAGRLVIEAAK
jgi:hypothetical protein